jgi:hypothetical protein
VCAGFLDARNAAPLLKAEPADGRGREDARLSEPQRPPPDLDDPTIEQWGRQGSNLRPRDYESPALTTELRPPPEPCPSEPALTTMPGELKEPETAPVIDQTRHQLERWTLSPFRNGLRTGRGAGPSRWASR